MSWADMKHHYQERDDDEPDDTGEVTIVTHSCPGCGKPVRAPIDAEGDETCCSSDCIKVVCDRLDAEIAAYRAAELAELAARMIDATCPGCGKVYKTLPEDVAAGLGCSKGCTWKMATELYADVPPVNGDEIPY